MKLYGKNPVLERLRANPDSIKEIYLQQKKDLSEIVRQIKTVKKEFISVDDRTMSSMAGNVNTQGVIAVVDEFKYSEFDKVIRNAASGRLVPVFVDGVTDPQNIGTIIRTLACIGRHALILPEHRSAGINETVLRVASGGENYIDIARIPNTSGGLRKARDLGITRRGAFADARRDIGRADISGPYAVVMGSEGKGIRPGLEKYIEDRVSIAMAGAPLSYNVAVAAALVCYTLNAGGGKNFERN